MGQSNKEISSKEGGSLYSFDKPELADIKPQQWMFVSYLFRFWYVYKHFSRSVYLTDLKSVQRCHKKCPCQIGNTLFLSCIFWSIIVLQRALYNAFLIFEAVLCETRLSGLCPNVCRLVQWHSFIRFPFGAFHDCIRNKREDCLCGWSFYGERFLILCAF